MEDKAERRRTCCQTLGKAFRHEFKCRHLGFCGANFELFPFAQWMWMDTFLYPIYRFFIANGLLLWVCTEIPLEVELSRNQNIRLNYFLYATNWSFLTYTLSSNIFAVFCTFYNCKKDAKVSKWPSEILWFFYGMSMNTVMVTSLVYWAAFWNPSYSRFYRPESKLKHSIPALTVFLDVGINGLPIRLFHALYPMIFGILYSTFSYFYYADGNAQPIYPVLDWSKPTKAAIACTLIVTFSLVMQFLLFLLYVGRITLSAHLKGQGQIVVDRWWKVGSQATPVKEVSKDIEAVESRQIAEQECQLMQNTQVILNAATFQQF
nr:hypothetical protein HmN_000810600 [Hymenolepis microstoma]